MGRDDADEREALRDGPEPEEAHSGHPSAPPHLSSPLSRQRRVYEKGRLRVDFDAYEVFLDGRRVRLFLREFELLRFFIRWPNRVFDRGEIMDSIWGSDCGVDPRTIDVHVRRLRTAIERDPSHPEVIVTIRRVGYKLVDRALETTAV